MRRTALALLALLLVAAPALGDDVTKKHQVDGKITSLQGQLAEHQRQASALRGQVADYTARIRALEAKVGDVSLHLQTLEADLALHQKRLDALNALFSLQSKRLTFLRGQYAHSMRVLNQRLVQIYESDQESNLEVFLGAAKLQDALDQVDYLTDIGVQDRRIATEVAFSRAQVQAARAKTKRIRTTVHGETAVISARAAQTRDIRDQLAGARNDLSSTKQQKVTDLSKLSAAARGEIQEIDSLQAASAALTLRIRAAQAQRSSSTTSSGAAGSSGSTSTPSSAGLIWPASGPITSPFGWRWGRMHEGIDIGAPYGAPIRAAASGTVIYCGWESGYGNLTVIDHGGNLATAYGHQSTIAVACGQQVTQGQVIGYVGATGDATGPHLHFEVRVNGAPVDPMGYL
jgi:murein DD-endopeptidase MepM/ murein hydrolase activator NlpD